MLILLALYLFVYSETCLADNYVIYHNKTEITNINSLLELEHQTNVLTQFKLVLNIDKLY